MKIVIPGGSGQVGALLARAFSADRHEVVVLSRYPGRAPWRTVQWDAERIGGWTAEFEGADVVVNLAGRSVNCRYTAENRRLIMESRVKSTRVVGAAIARATRPTPHLAAGEHGDDLRSHVRSAERRVHRRDGRCRGGRAGHLAVQHRRRHRLGAGGPRGGHTPDPQGAAPFGDDDE
jgi:NAD dependent epimerase/dehydratase family enzyme